MKIGIVCYPTYGGSGIVATELGMALAKKGHEVHFIAYNQPVKLEFISERVYFHQVFVPDYPLFHYEPYELALASRIVDRVQRFGIDVLHVHYAIPHAYAAHNAKEMLREEGIEIPIVTTLHGTDITLVGVHPCYNRSVKFSINKSDIVTCVSQSLKEDTIEFFDLKREIEVVPNFIDFDHFKRKKDFSEFIENKADDEFVLTHVSNFRPVKRIQDIIEAFSIISKRVKAKLLLVGDGPEMQKMQMLCQKYKIEDKVKFLGNSDDIASILSVTDLFYLLSEKESFGLSALEAMALSVPVISSNTGGLPEVNSDNFSGFTVDVGDINQVVEKSLEILESKEKLDLFKKQAFENAKRFDITNVMPQYLDIYQRAIDKVKLTNK
jgi:N-acetyl-alpha-D-glucosaminyl L-malate synthase BshA